MGSRASKAHVDLRHVDAKVCEQRVKVSSSVETYYCCFGFVPWSVRVRNEGSAEDFYGPDAMSTATKRTTTIIGTDL